MTAAAWAATNHTGRTRPPAAASASVNAARPSRPRNVRSRIDVHSAPMWSVASDSANTPSTRSPE